MIDRPAGAVNAALTPLTNRVAISTVAPVARPPSPEATRKTASEIRNIRRRPSRSAALPPSSRKPPYPSTYALTTHCSELVDMFRSSRIDGSATPIIETSSASRNSAPQRTISVPQARLESWPTGCATATDTWTPPPVLFDRDRTYLFDARQTMTSPVTETTPDLDEIDVLTVLRALADPVRLQIVRQLAGCAAPAEMRCGQIELPVTKSTASHHLKTLACA